MKRFSAMALVILLLSVSCKDHDMFGNIEISVNVASLPSQTGAYTVGLFDPVAHSDFATALYETTLVAGKAGFQDVNPGNYVVVIETTNIYRGVQVRAGKTSSLTFH